ncbi:MAG: MFS transporter [Oceanicaulis sp.]|nr:MFS transporter [Oceanicaulis sp.]
MTAPAGPSETSPDTLRPHARLIAFSLICAFLSAPGQTFFIAVFTAPVAASIGLGPGAMGALYMAATLGAAAILPFAGSWIDRLDLRLYAALALACFVMAGATGALGAGLGFLLLRLTGQGLMTHVAMTSTVRFFTRVRGRALSIVGLGLPLSEALTPAAALGLIALAGWREAYVVVGVVVLVLALPLLQALIARQPRFNKPVRAAGAEKPSAWAAARMLTGSRHFWLILPLIIFLPFAATGLLFQILPLAEARGWPVGWLGAAFMGFAAGHALGLLVVGRLIDRYGGTRLLPLMNLPTLAALGVLAVSGHPLGLIAFLTAMGMASGLAQSAVSAMWVEVYGVAQAGSVRSFAVMIMVASTAAGPAVLGALLEAGAGPAMIAGLLAASVVAFSGLAALSPAQQQGYTCSR